ncbi:MAG: hypothetical protein MUF64_10795 [Polyangiaceae bacterium]|nr:hypothetical protein [Polyangiaceae bacterium]
MQFHHGICFQPPPPCDEDEVCKQFSSLNTICHKVKPGEQGKCGRPCAENPEVCGQEGRCDKQSGRCVPNQCDPPNQEICRTGEICGQMSLKCIPQPCAETSACPRHHVCLSTKGCVPQACKCDTECSDGGFCVRGFCAEKPGYCEEYTLCGRPLVVEQTLVRASLLRGVTWG